ncbi:MAG: pantetheine-phosphate adenylyltransferase [Coriobacteriales bacterium]|nr:pantetheine-phosphate adenylyltransferase [Coriobacteriales bacterium]
MSDKKSKKGQYRRLLVPGTYDPITRGHIDVIERSTHLADEVIVAVAASQEKRGGPAFTLDQRVEMARCALEGLENVVVMPFEGLLVDFARELGDISAVVKGLRAITDFEYEFQQAQLNYMLAPEIEAIFVMSAVEYGYVSSSAVREIASFGGDVSFLVTPNVEAALRKRFGARK